MAVYIEIDRYDILHKGTLNKYKNVLREIDDSHVSLYTHLQLPLNYRSYTM